jgi:hypothetical protein
MSERKNQPVSSVTPKPFSKWDLERFIYSDPALNSTQRFVAIQVLKTLDNKFRPVRSGLLSQALIGYRVARWRETVNKALRHLVVLGYFRTSWITVQRPTVQGIKGVTRVMCELGPALRRLVEKNRSPDQVSAGQAHGVTSDHPSPAPPGRPGTVGSSVIAKSADRTDGAFAQAEFKRKTLERWPRLAGSKPVDPARLPSAVPFAELAERERAAIERGELLEVTEEEAAARLADRGRRISAATTRRLAGLRDELASRRAQPRRKPPRSHR